MPVTERAERQTRRRSAIHIATRVEAQRCIERFLEKVYTEKRRHLVLGYRPPTAGSQSVRD